MGNIIQAIKIAFWDKYKLSTLWTVDAIPFALNYNPNSKNYPLIVINHVKTNSTMAMPSTVQLTGYNYVDSRFSLIVYGNTNNHATIEGIADSLETLYHRSSLPTAGGVTHIATIFIDGQTIFYDQGQKIWGINQYIRVLAGK